MVVLPATSPNIKNTLKTLNLLKFRKLFEFDPTLMF